MAIQSVQFDWNTTKGKWKVDRESSMSLAFQFFYLVYTTIAVIWDFSVQQI
jgi:hypothetical protein